MVALLSLAVACGPSAVTSSGTTARLAVAGTARRIVSLTDLEEIRDVAQGASEIFVATDGGLIVFPAEGAAAPRVIGRAQGLPSQDVIALALEPDGALLVSTAAGLASVRGEEITPIEAPLTARPMDLALLGDGTAWLCTLSGVLRRNAEGVWERFGDPLACTTLAATPEGQLWVGTAQGALFVDGYVVREDPISGGIPEAYVRSIVPVLPGQVLALVNGPSRAQLAFFDGRSWHGYTVPGLEEPVVGLVSREGGAATLVTRDRALAIAPTGSGIGLRALSSTVATVRSFRAALTSDAGQPPEPPAETVRGLQTMTVPREGAPSVDAPSLVALPLTVVLPPNVYRAIQVGARAYAAAANAGAMELTSGGRRLRTGSLVPDDDLQVATDVGHNVWVRVRGGEVAKVVDGRLRHLVLPEELHPQAIANGVDGAYLAAIVGDSNVIRVFRSESGAFRPLLERTLELPTRLSAIPFMGVGPNGHIWLAVRAEREDGGGSRLRGLVELDPASEAVVHHHRAAPEMPALQVPDEVAAMTFDANGAAWIATLSGAVRIADQQAIVFDESRGVRGEVVTDIVGGGGGMWIAAAEGLGLYAERSFDFHQPPIVTSHRPVALAIDREGHLWAAGPSGVLHHDGTDWSHLGEAAGLPTEDFRDVEVDGGGRVWLLPADAVVTLTP